MQKRLIDLVPEILYVRAFKFAVSRDVNIAVQLKFTLYMCIYIVDKDENISQILKMFKPFF